MKDRTITLLSKDGDTVEVDITDNSLAIRIYDVNRSDEESCSEAFLGFESMCVLRDALAERIL